MKHNIKKVILLILDGWGIAKPDKFNAIANAKKPNYDRLIREFPNTQLYSHGLFVGLPEDQFGTSEINHQVIGSGRVILQDLPKIDTVIKDKSFYNNEVLVELCKNATKNKKALHLIGIISDGKIHASIEHLYAMIDLAKKEGVKNLYVHAFTDGRDTPPKSAKKYLDLLQEKLVGFENASISTLQGRFYLDRDRDWAKSEMAIDLIVKGKGIEVSSYDAAINISYNQNVTDEFFTQYVIDKNGLVSSGDSVFFMHYRSDRLFQIVSELLKRNISNLKVGTFIELSSDIKTMVAYPRPVVTHSLAETVSLENKKQFHITETEKYTHLTYFFNCGQEKPFKGEEWKLFESEKYVKPFYNYFPTMQNYLITREIVKKIEQNDQDLIIANYCSPDMVGHTGNYEAAVISAESVDYSLGKIWEVIKHRLDEYTLLITSDHGNSDIMWDYENNQPHTQHTTSPVPFIFVSDIKAKLDAHESLEDIAPTILDLMHIEIPQVMTGTSLIIKRK